MVTKKSKIPTCSFPIARDASEGPASCFGLRVVLLPLDDADPALDDAAPVLYDADPALDDADTALDVAVLASTVGRQLVLMSCAHGCWSHYMFAIRISFA